MTRRSRQRIVTKPPSFRRWLFPVVSDANRLTGMPTREIVRRGVAVRIRVCALSDAPARAFRRAHVCFGEGDRKWMRRDQIDANDPQQTVPNANRH